jgi:hypothetical protein
VRCPATSPSTKPEPQEEAIIEFNDDDRAYVQRWLKRWTSESGEGKRFLSLAWNTPNHGWPTKAIQERLGHSTSRMTLDIYVQATATIPDQGVAAMHAFYERSGISGQISGQSDKTACAQPNENPAIACGI